MDRIVEFTGDYHFLSNFANASIKYDGLLYPTVEHAYQTAKSTDRSERIHIMHAPHPGMAKLRGREAKHLRKDWEAVKRETMAELLFLKFKAEPMRSKLLATGMAQLIHGNKHKDEYWGVRLDDDEVDVGANYLGRMLMNLRDLFKTVYEA